ncbi:MAG: hypothetical protein ABI584_05625 [Acidobacteriota bacterium]
MELEELQRLWADQDKKLDAGIQLSKRLLHATVMGKAEAATRPLSRLLWFELLFTFPAVLLIGSFLAEHVAEARFFIPALGLHLGVIALLVSGIRQLAVLRTIDYGAPILAIQKRLASLRVLRIRTVKWTFILAPLAWTPLLIVVLKGLFGVDAYSMFGARWLIANVLFGLAVIALAIWLSRRYADQMDRSPVLQRLMRELAGQSLTTAKSVLGSLSQYEEEERRA